MLSLTFGLLAAVCWGLNNFIIRILKQLRGIYASMAAILFLDFSFKIRWQFSIPKCLEYHISPYQFQ